jgi:hypothetical protein
MPQCDKPAFDLDFNYFKKIFVWLLTILSWTIYRLRICRGASELAPYFGGRCLPRPCIFRMIYPNVFICARVWRFN